MLVSVEEICQPGIYFRTNKIIPTPSPILKAFHWKEVYTSKVFFHTNMKGPSVLTWRGGGHDMPLDGGYPASAAQLLAPAQLGRWISPTVKEEK